MNKQYNTVLFIVLLMLVIYGQFFATGVVKEFLQLFWEIVTLIIIGSYIYKGAKKEYKKSSKK